MTVKQAAEFVNVSERSVYLAGELMRTGRDTWWPASTRVSSSFWTRYASPSQKSMRSGETVSAS
jgi:hypothetical protein